MNVSNRFEIDASLPISDALTEVLHCSPLTDWILLDNVALSDADKTTVDALDAGLALKALHVQGHADSTVIAELLNQLMRFQEASHLQAVCRLAAQRSVTVPIWDAMAQSQRRELLSEGVMLGQWAERLWLFFRHKEGSPTEFDHDALDQEVGGSRLRH